MALIFQQHEFEIEKIINYIYHIITYLYTFVDVNL